MDRIDAMNDLHEKRQHEAKVLAEVTRRAKGQNWQNIVIEVVVLLAGVALLWYFLKT